MKVTKLRLKQIVKEEIGNALKEVDITDYPEGESETEFSPERLGHAYGGHAVLGFDDLLNTLKDMFEEIAEGVLEEYKGYEEFNKEAARKEIIMVLEAALTGFIEGTTEGQIDLDHVLDDHFFEEETLPSAEAELETPR